MFTSLMTTRRFAPLFLCQFFAAFGDNFLKTALGFLILFQVTGANSAALDHSSPPPLSSRRSSSCPGSAANLPTAYDKALGGAAHQVRRDVRAPRSPWSGFAFHSLIVLFVALFLFGTLGVAVRADQIRHPARSSWRAKNCRPAMR